MRHVFKCFRVFCVLAVIAWTAPQAHAQQGAADFAELYQSWQQAQDPEQMIAVGEQLLALEPSLATWPLAIERTRAKGRGEVRPGQCLCLASARRACRQPGEGDRHLQAALAILTREADPQSWGKAHNNLGIAYWGRIRGERADNQEKAIAHFEAALTVFSRESAAREWAQLQNNLAVVYLQADPRRARRQPGEGDRALRGGADGLHARGECRSSGRRRRTTSASPIATACRASAPTIARRRSPHLEAALTVLTREAFAHEWAHAQNNLANGLSGSHPRGTRRATRRRRSRISRRR